MNEDFLSNVVNRMEQTKANLNILNEANNESAEKVIKVSPKDISNWEFRDRQEFELGDIEALAESIKTKGQAQPIIIVHSDNVFKSIDNKDNKYIVIAGYRRWLACRLNKCTVDAIVRPLNFAQAIACLVSENEKEQVSDYSKGMFYFNLLKKERVYKKDLYEKLGINRSVFDNYLSFGEVPKEVWDAVKDMRKVSARTSSTIKYICLKGEEYKSAILAIADKIALGAGEKKIKSLINKILSENKNLPVKNATRVAFSKNVFIEIREDSLFVTAKKIKSNELNELKVKICQILKNFCNE